MHINLIRALEFSKCDIEVISFIELVLCSQESATTEQTWETNQKLFYQSSQNVSLQKAQEGQKLVIIELHRSTSVLSDFFLHAVIHLRKPYLCFFCPW